MSFMFMVIYRFSYGKGNYEARVVPISLYQVNIRNLYDLLFYFRFNV